ncbi:MAG: hypothetical protein M3N50_09565 [Pseudomonadota bacterium]|nr:hypothetical protein [Pseudomonadota bacterium]
MPASIVHASLADTQAFFEKSLVQEKIAEGALYESKEGGRNRGVLSAAEATAAVVA